MQIKGKGESPRHKTVKTRERGASAKLMSDVNEKNAVSKDGTKENNRLMDLIKAVSAVGFRVVNIKTNGTDFELMVR